LCIFSVQGRVTRLHAQAKETSDVNLLPPPEQVVTLSLGYRAALADLLWAEVLVSQGLRTMALRRYDTVTDLLDTINALDPEFRDPYIWSDALVTLQITEARLEDVYRTRIILERGMKNRPLDPDIWRTAGQFIAFIAPATFLKDEKEQAAWRLDGARMLARSAEMGGDKDYAGWSAISSAGILSRQGERDAAIRLIQRTLAVTEDEELRDMLQRQLATLIGETKIDAYKKRQAELIEISRHDLPFVSKTTLHILGPPFDTAYCAGGKLQADKRCAITWNAWAAADDAATTP
jgi:tetratricopeptide (TPR) repeat protein